MQPWQEVVNEYDHKAHKKKGWVSLRLTGGFRAIDDERAAAVSLAYAPNPDEGYAEVIQQVIDDLTELLPKARDLDRRIAKRKNQKPEDRKYLYGSQE